MKRTGFLVAGMAMLGFLGAQLAAEPVDLDYQFSNFYRTRDHSIAPELLVDFLTKYPTVPEHTYWPSAFFFSRIFLGTENYEKLKGIYRAESKSHRNFVLDVLYLKATQQTKPILADLASTETDSQLREKAKRILDHEDFVYDPLEEEITNSNQLDMLWMVFLTSGELAPVDKIVGLLAWKDSTRQKVSDLPTRTREYQESASLLRKFGVELSEAGIKNIDDLDIRLVQFLQQGRLSDEFKRLRTLLKISDQEVYRMALKGAAFWALRSNAQQHEKVFARCKELALDPSMPGHVMLRVLIASVERS